MLGFGRELDAVRSRGAGGSGGRMFPLMPMSVRAYSNQLGSWRALLCPVAVARWGSTRVPLSPDPEWSHFDVECESHF